MADGRQGASGPVEPRALRWVDAGRVLEIEWTDGHVSRYEQVYLRRVCPCATCAGHHGPSQPQREAGAPTSRRRKGRFTVLDDAQARQARQARAARGDVRAVHTWPIGRYAMGIRWSDGHDAGIYSWRYLRSVCPCGEDGAHEVK